MDVSESTLLEILPEIYDGALWPERWTSALGRIVGAMGGMWGTLAWSSVRLAPVGHCFAGSPAMREAYEREYFRQDPLLPRIRHVPPGTVCLLEDYVPRDAFIELPFYREWARPHGIESVVCAVLSRTGDDIDGLCGIGLAAAEPADAERRIGLFTALVPHLQRALQIGRRIRRADQERDAAIDLTESLAVGQILLGAGGQVYRMNRRARSIVTRADGLTVHHDGLRAATLGDTARLQRLLAAAALHPGEPQGIVRVARPSGKPPLGILALGLVPRDAGDQFGPAVAILVNDPDVAPQSLLPALREMFLLTRAEAALCAQLSIGATLELASQRLNISLSTARTQLKRVLEKTGTHRQAELVHLVLTTIAPFRV